MPTPLDRADFIARSPLAWSIIAGAILALAYPPFNLGSLAYVAPAIAIWAAGLHDRFSLPSWKTVFGRAWAFGTMFHLCTLYWTGWVSIPGMCVTVSVLGAYVALVFVLTRSAVLRFGSAGIWAFPIVWIAHEYLRGLCQLAFPWTNLSLSQVWAVPLLQFAEFTGDLGVSLLVAVINTCIFEAWRQYPLRGRSIAITYAAIILALIVIPLAWGAVRMSNLTNDGAIRIAVLQGDIDSYAKWEDDFVDRSIAVYETQTRDAVAQGAELVVWPETAAPMYLRSETKYLKSLLELSRELETRILIGTLEFKRLEGGGYLRYNAATQLSHGFYEKDFHAKLHLVPLGERIPFSDYFQVLDKLEVGGAHFTPGENYVTFEHPKGDYAANICYESVFPDIVRRFALMGARFLVVITNDGWYGFSSGPTQHAAHAILRAVETRIPVARSANTGISCFVDRKGLMHEISHQYVPDVRIFDLPLGVRNATTFFTRHGMWLGQACVGATLVFVIGLVIGWFRRAVVQPARSGLEA